MPGGFWLQLYFLRYALTISGLAKSHGACKLFSGANFRLSPGRRVSLVGANVAGKTTKVYLAIYAIKD